MRTANSYDLGSRLLTVRDNGTNKATYSYLADSPLASQIMFTNGSALRMTTSKQYDFLNRLQAISSSNSVLPAPISYAYAYNDANQRTAVHL